MYIIPSDSELWNSEIEKIFGGAIKGPVTLGGGSCMYILIKDLDDALEAYIATGMTDRHVLRVFSDERERAMAEGWERSGLRVTYRSQKIEYMHDTATITFPQVRDPVSGMKIALIPWFLIPGRPYPVFAYIFAIRHYQITGEKSLSESAAAAGKTFGIDSLNKSTVSRSIAAFGGFAESARIERPLAVDAPDTPTDAEMIGRIPELLRGSPAGTPAETAGGTPGSVPTPTIRAEAARMALSGVPDGHCSVTREAGSRKSGKRRGRKRPARPRGKPLKCVQQRMVFVDSRRIWEARKAFIGVCLGLAMDAATAHHRFLI